jgi:hypothetical protein
VPDPPAGLLEDSGRAFQVHRLPQELHLGEMLNHGIDHATGVHWAKMDDDDWYGRDHLLDLRLAMEYSGADLVGKRIDHIYLAPIERTVTRRRAAPERDRPHVSGPTLFGRTDLLQRIRFGKLTGPRTPTSSASCWPTAGASTAPTASTWCSTATAATPGTPTRRPSSTRPSGTSRASTSPAPRAAPAPSSPTDPHA